MSGEIPGDYVFENENLIVIKTIAPEAKTHLLIIPRKEIPTINDITEEDAPLISEMFFVAKKIAKELGIEEGYELHFNVWPKKQEVMHIHLHLMSDI